MQLPVEAVAPVVGGMALAIAALWAWLKRLYRKVEELQKALLDEKERHVKELEEFKRMVEKRRREE